MTKSTGDPAPRTAPDTERSPGLSKRRRVRLVRLAQLLAALGAVAAALIVGDSFPLTTWVFWVATASAFSAVLVEPHWTGLGAAATHAAAAVGVFATTRAAPTEGIDALWWGYLAVYLAAFVAAAVGLTSGQETPPPRLTWVATRIARPALVGGAALLIEAIRVASISTADAVALAFGVAGFSAAVLIDWPRVALGRTATAKDAVFEAAVYPNLLLFSSSADIPVGCPVRICRGSSAVSGHVVGRLEHKRSNRYQVVADHAWRGAFSQSGDECLIETVEGDQGQALGFVVEGTTELTTRLQPVAGLEPRQSVILRLDGHEVLFQVTRLRLEQTSWDGSAGLQARAEARQIGELRDGRIALRPRLPDPYQLVERGTGIRADLPDGYTRIGRVAGTQIPIGVRRDWPANEGHVGVLGMSGMGKTTSAQLLAQAFGDSTPFIALDATGEYRTKLGWDAYSAWADLDWQRTGQWVFEPRGQLAEQAKNIIASLMTVANGEFEVGEPRRRVLLLEEAHGFLPEWNFASSKTEQQHVSASCRCILQSRKFGISYVMVSQRTAVISKSSISQCENFLIFRTIDGTSLEFIDTLVGDAYREVVSGLKRFQALCVGPIFNAESPVVVDLDAPPGAAAT